MRRCILRSVATPICLSPAGRVKALELTSHSRVPYFMVNVIVKNGNWHAVKDLEFVCRHYDEDGVVIGKNRKTIPITMPGRRSPRI